MAKVSRNVKQGLINQGEQEEVDYTLTVTPWGSNPTDALVQVIDRTDNDQDVTSSVTDDATADIVGDEITTPLIKSLTAEHLYRVYVQFKIGIKTLRAYFEIEAEL
jgi:hypothetical protein